MFAAGLAVTLGNPKIMVFYLALLPTIIDLGGLTVWGWGELVAVMLVVLIAIDAAWVLMAARARRLLKSPRAVRLAKPVQRRDDGRGRIGDRRTELIWSFGLTSRRSIPCPKPAHRRHHNKPSLLA